MPLRRLYFIEGLTLPVLKYPIPLNGWALHPLFWSQIDLLTEYVNHFHKNDIKRKKIIQYMHDCCEDNTYPSGETVLKELGLPLDAEWRDEVFRFKSTRHDDSNDEDDDFAYFPPAQPTVPSQEASSKRGGVENSDRIPVNERPPRRSAPFFFTRGVSSAQQPRNEEPTKKARNTLPTAASSNSKRTYDDAPICDETMAMKNLNSFKLMNKKLDQLTRDFGSHLTQQQVKDEHIKVRFH